MSKLIIFFLLLFSLFDKDAFADFDEGLVTKAKALVSKEKYTTADGDEISKAVQTLNFLGFQLQKNNDLNTSKNIADTIIEIISTGKGVGGLRPRTHKHAFLNKTEKELVVGALTKAVEYLQLRGLLGDLSDRILALVGKISPDDRVKKHAAIVSSLMYGAYAKATEAADFNTAKGAWVGTLFGDARFSTYEWLPVWLGNADIWKYADAYMPEDLSEFNAIEWAKLERAAAEEEQQDRIVYGVPSEKIDYSTVIKTKDPAVLALQADLTDRDAWHGITTLLENTLVDRKAQVLVNALQEALKNTTLKDIFADDARRALKQQIIRAIIAVESYKMYETSNGQQKNEDPSLFDYNDVPDAENQIILLALVSAIQNYLYNPQSTLDDLQNLFGYQIHDFKLPAVVRALASGFNSQPLITKVFEEIQAHKKPFLAINKSQMIAIDQSLLQRSLLFYGIPHFDIETGLMQYVPTFISHFGSAGDGLRCGFYSLGFCTFNKTKPSIPDWAKADIDLNIDAVPVDELFSSRGQALAQIIDNLGDDRIYSKAYRISTFSKYLQMLIEREEEIAAIVGDSDVRLAEWNIKKGEIKAAEILKGKHPKTLIERNYKVMDRVIQAFKRRYPEHATKHGKALLAEIKHVKSEAEATIKAPVATIKQRHQATKITGDYPIRIPNDEFIWVWLMSKISKGDIDLEHFDLAGNALEICNIIQNDLTTNVAIFQGLLDRLPKQPKAKVTLKTTLDKEDGATVSDTVTGDYQELRDRFVPATVQKATEIIKYVAQSKIGFLALQEQEELDSVYKEMGKAFFTLEDFQKFIADDIRFTYTLVDPINPDEARERGALPINVTFDWRTVSPNYESLLGEINNYNIYTWIPKTWTDDPRHNAVPIHITEDGQVSLVGYLHQSKTAKRVMMRHTGGFHYEKWIESGSNQSGTDSNVPDYPRLARAIRHGH